MKRLSVVVMAISLCMAVSMAIAGEVRKGTVKSVDLDTASIVITMDGKDVTLKAGEGVDFGRVRTGDKVETVVEKETVQSIKITSHARSKVMTGC